MIQTHDIPCGGTGARTPGWPASREKDIKWRSDHNMQRSNIYKHQHNILPVSLQPTRAQAGAYRPAHGQSGHSSSLLSPAPAQLIRARLYSAFGNIKNQTPRHSHRLSDRDEICGLYRGGECQCDLHVPEFIKNLGQQ